MDEEDYNENAHYGGEEQGDNYDMSTDQGAREDVFKK